MNNPTPPAPKRQYVGCRFRPGGTIFTYHNDGPHVAVGDRVKLPPARRGEGWSRSTVETVGFTKPNGNFETKAILGRVEDVPDAPVGPVGKDDRYMLVWLAKGRGQKGEARGPTLDRLIAAGMVEQDKEDDPRGDDYRWISITDKGREALKASPAAPPDVNDLFSGSSMRTWAEKTNLHPEHPTRKGGL